MAPSFVRKNMGMIDRVIRTVSGLAMMYVGFYDQAIIGNLTINCGVMAVVCFWGGHTKGHSKTHDNLFASQNGLN